MNYYKFILHIVASISICLMMSCKDEIECDPPDCGVGGYHCVKGECICPEDMIELNESNCILNREGDYFGSFDCGCYNDLVITILENQGQVSFYEGNGNHGTHFNKIDDQTYTFFFQKNCEWNDIQTEFVQFEMKELEEGKFWVTAMWTRQLGFEVVYECSTMFID